MGLGINRIKFVRCSKQFSLSEKDGISKKIEIDNISAYLEFYDNLFKSSK